MAPRTTSPFTAVKEISQDIVGSPAEVRRRGGVIPSWVVFGMVIAATFAVCVTVTMRTRTKMSTASQQFASMQTDVDGLRVANQALRIEIQQLSSDPRTIEAAARSRLNMVRPNEIVVPVE